MNFIIDFLLLVLLGAVTWTGLVMRYILPPGFRGCYGWTLWGLSRHDYGNIHFAFSVLLTLLSALHLALHWKWFCFKVGQFFRCKGRIIAAIIVLVILFMSVVSMFFLDQQVVKPKPRLAEQALSE